MHHDEGFGRLLKMTDVFVCHRLIPRYFVNGLVVQPCVLHLSILLVFFSWSQHVLHLHHRLSLWRSGHLRCGRAHFPHGGHLVRQIRAFVVRNSKVAFILSPVLEEHLIMALLH